MATKQQPILYALNEVGEIKHIDEVERGDDCKCRCIACGEKLIAKKGDRRLKIHHFAHAPGVECQYGYESSLHLMAKQILEDSKKMLLPAVYVGFPHSNRKPSLLSPPREICIESVELEVHYRKFIPDIVIKSGKRILFVEIFVKHAVDKDKLARIENENISTIEIDLSDLDKDISRDELSRVLAEDVQRKQWIYNAKEFECRRKFIDNSKNYVVKTISTPVITDTVPNCPWPSRLLVGKKCADYWRDCVCCPYFIKKFKAQDGMNYVQCTGAECIADCDDFLLEKEERIRNSRKKRIAPFSDRLKETISSLDKSASGICPNCGCALREKIGKHGKFWGCYMHPSCKFAIWYDPAKGEYLYKND